MAVKAPTPWQTGNYGGSKNASVLVGGKAAAKIMKRRDAC